MSVWIGSKDANRRLSFGFHRAEVIGALASVILIWGLTLILVLEAIERLIDPVEVNGYVMLVTASLGLVSFLTHSKNYFNRLLHDFLL